VEANLNLQLAYLSRTEVPRNAALCKSRRSSKRLVWLAAQDDRQKIQKTVCGTMFRVYQHKRQVLHTLYSLQEWWDVASDSGERRSQRLAQPASKHQIKLVVKKFRQIRAYCRGKHPNTLEDRLFGRCVLFTI
jgi:hypothetical protein